jgi:arylsulfatase A-like enzyme
MRRLTIAIAILVLFAATIAIWFKTEVSTAAERHLLEASSVGIYRIDDLLEQAEVVGPEKEVLAATDVVLWQWDGRQPHAEDDDRFTPSHLGVGLTPLELEEAGSFVRLSAPRRRAGAFVPVAPIEGYQLGLVLLEVRSTDTDEFALSLGEEFGARGLRMQPARLFVETDGEWHTVVCTAEELGVAPGDGIDELAIIVSNWNGKPHTLDVASIRLMSARSRYCGAAAGPATLERAGVLRSGMFVNTSTVLRYPFRVPRDGRFMAHVTGADEKSFALRISITSQGEREILFEESIPGFTAARDLGVDCSAHAGSEVIFELEVIEEEQATVALLMHPMLTGHVENPRPNVLFYMCDTLRADSLGCYGSPHSGTPNLDRLAAEGVRFERCFSQAPWTYVSVPSSFTSLYPSANGVQMMGDELSDEVETWVETFRRAGYLTTGLITNGFVGRSTHLEQGYDILFEPSAVFGERGNASTLFVEQQQQSSDLLNARLEPWLDTFSDVPFFLFVHAVDPHEPYQPAEPFLSEYVTPEEHEEFLRDYLTLRGERPRPNVRKTRGEIAAAGVDPDRYARVSRALYDAEVAGFDRALGELLDSLDERALSERTLFAFTSDHGEEFLEHGVTSHAHSSYNELLHIPWIMRLPGVLPAGVIYRENTAALDLAPTVLSLVGIEPPAVMQGRNLIPSLLRGQTQPERTIFAEQWRAPTEVVTGEAFAIFVGQRKAIVRRTSYEGLDQPAFELFDLARDFGERTNLEQNGPDPTAIRERIEARVQAWWAEQEELRTRFTASRAGGISASEIESLRALGYVE